MTMASMSALASLAQYGSSDSEVDDILESTDVFVLRRISFSPIGKYGKPAQPDHR